MVALQGIGPAQVRQLLVARFVLYASGAHDNRAHPMRSVIVHVETPVTLHVRADKAANSG